MSEEPVATADTLPPMPRKDLLSSSGANLFVLSVDPALIDAVQRAGGEQFPVVAVDRWEDLDAAVESDRCGIAILDADLVGDRLTTRIVALDRYSDRVVVLVAADRSAAQQLMGLLSDRKIHRLLIKPPALGITRLLIESAVNRCLQLRTSAMVDDGLEARPSAGGSRRTTGTPAWVFASAAAALLLGVGLVAAMTAWWHEDSAADGKATLAAAAIVPAAPVASGRELEPAPGRFAALLSKAERAFREGRLAAPTGDNALDYYLTILAADPMQATARNQLAAVVDALFADAEAALLANSTDAAAAALASVRRADPTSSRLAFLETQLERSRAEALAARAAVPPVRAAAPPAARAELERAAAAASPRTELDSLLTIGQARLRRGQLLEPAGDSAREYADRAAKLQPNDSRVAALRAELAVALATAARIALEEGDYEAATVQVAEAQRFGADAEALALLEIEVTTARIAQARRQQAEWLSLAQARIRSGALVSPAGDSAWHYLTELQNEAPDFFGLAATWQEFVAAAAGNARAAIAARNWTAAEAQISVLRQRPQGAATATSLLEELEVGRLQEQFLAAAVPAGELRLLSVAPAVYPVEAQERGVEGWVELEFVVDRSGQPQDLAVVAAEPERRFELAALAAVRQYRYAPFERNGRAYERRVRLRVRFMLE